MTITNHITIKTKKQVEPMMILQHFSLFRIQQHPLSVGSLTTLVEVSGVEMIGLSSFEELDVLGSLGVCPRDVPLDDDLTMRITMLPLPFPSHFPLFDIKTGEW